MTAELDRPVMFAPGGATIPEAIREPAIDEAERARLIDTLAALPADQLAVVENLARRHRIPNLRSHMVTAAHGALIALLIEQAKTGRGGPAEPVEDAKPTELSQRATKGRPGRRPPTPSASQIAGLLDDGRSRSFAWSASGIAATVAVHHPDQWHGLDTAGCTHDKTGFCPACRYLRSAFDREWTTKADLGTHIHHLALDWAQGRDIETDDTTEPYVDCLEAFYLGYRPEWLHTERTVGYSTPTSHAYVGQFDGIAIVDCPTCSTPTEKARCKWLVDFKTGGFWAIEQTLQLAAYRYAQHLTVWTPVEGKAFRCRRDGCDLGSVHDHCGRCGHVEHHRPYARPGFYKGEVDQAMPTVAHAGVVLLNPEHGGRLVELPANGDAFGTFLRLRDAWGWAQQMRQWERENPLAGGLIEIQGVAS